MNEETHNNRALKITVTKKVAILLTAMAFSGCSSLLFSIGTDVAKYDAPEVRYSRNMVMKDFGRPIHTKRFPSAQPMAELDRAHPSYGHRMNSDLFTNSLVLTIDEYRIRGAVYDRYRNEAFVGTFQYAVFTLGISELFFLPCAVAATVSDIWEDRRLRMFYDPSDEYIDYSLETL